MPPTFTEEPKLESIESEVIRRAKEGDALAFEYLYKAHSRQVYAICLRILKNTSDAEDLTQQIFLRAFRRIATLRGDSSFSAWLYRVTVNAVLTRVRQQETGQHGDDSGVLPGSGRAG